MSLSIEHICLDCRDAYALAEFWSEALGQPMDPEDAPGAPEAGFDLPAGHDFLFVQVPEPKAVKNRMHLCLRSKGPLDGEVARLLGVGATVFDDRRQIDGAGWVVLTDPEGNEFCLLPSSSTRDAQPD